MAALDFKALMLAERKAAQAEAIAPAPDEAVGLSTRAELRDAALGRFRVGGQHAADDDDDDDGPPVWYVPEFLTAEGERELLRDIAAVPGGWVQLSQRRLRTFGGTPHPCGIVMEPLPACMAAVAARLAAAAPGVFALQQPDHVLLNEYAGGQGIGRHKDGPMYAPAVAVVSMGAPALIEFEQERGEGGGSRRRQSLMLMPRSLLLFSGAAYTGWTHAIATRRADVVDESCVNCALAGVRVGQRVERSGGGGGGGGGGDGGGGEGGEGGRGGDSGGMARRVSLTVRRVVLPRVEEDFTEEGREEARRRREWFQSSVNEGSPPQWSADGSAKSMV
jgi:alkylated DNA repair protein alkB family protein 6